MYALLGKTATSPPTSDRPWAGKGEREPDIPGDGDGCGCGGGGDDGGGGGGGNDRLKSSRSYGQSQTSSEAVNSSERFFFSARNWTPSSTSVMNNFVAGAFLLLAVASTAAEAKKIHYVHWNKASPLFRIDNTDHIIDVKEFDQVNLICPVSKPGTKFPEKHVIYSVSREEYESCRITNPKPRIVAICNHPHRLMYFTITFRSFTPTPGGLEFHPGQDYYFVSTSSRDDLHRRVGGGCSTHNMKMIFKVHPSPRQQQQLSKLPPTKIPFNLNAPRLNIIPDGSSTEKIPQYNLDRDNANVETEENNSNIYYYHPRDVVALERSLVSSISKRRPAMTPSHSRRQTPLLATTRELFLPLKSEEDKGDTSAFSSAPRGMENLSSCLMILVTLIISWLRR